ncbi:hypothetical protein [Microbacterium sp. T2.11-28]|uniref:hypothetical protein n=1 Tax=Microbacterium sp. T2.11-28 TaxID=3041169 RepID=UPI002477A111|nr:hypothetical protein [Microbacterium sp. T2.11-28]CAI9386085.1 hypothetical protein MICABA_00165 [Microbacterium sp. T2.11-28]
MSTSPWYTAAPGPGQTRLLAAWPGADSLVNPELVGMLLDVAKEQVLAFAPALEPAAQVRTLLEDLGVEEASITAVITLLDFEDNPSDPPTRYAYAQLRQAQTLWAAGEADENGNIGTEGFSYVPRPLDKTIRGIIRPKSGTVDVF